VASLSQGRSAAAQCGLFTHKSVPVIFEPPCKSIRQHAAGHQYTQSVAQLYDKVPVFRYVTSLWEPQTLQQIYNI